MKSPLPWLLPPVLLATVAAGAWFVPKLPAGVFLWVAGLLFTAPILWVAVSALWPASAERGCPACGAEALERLDARTAVGVRCGACGFRDEERSAWLLAEEEGPLEDIVLAQRGRRKPVRPGLDSSPGGD